MPEVLTRREPARAAPQLTFWTELILLFGIGVAVLIPSFWQTRVQAGDFSSHIYNAWLAGEIHQGTVDGVRIVPVHTNVLADWVLTALFPLTGANWAEHIVAGFAASVFFWGAFYLLNTVTGTRPWLFCPILAILTYGLIFHLGFLNFYLATGFSLWILGLLWRPTRNKGLWVPPLTAVALLAHALPVVWAFAIIIYLQVFRRAPNLIRMLMPAGGVLALAALQAMILRQLPARWSWSEVTSLSGIAAATGVDQIWLYDAKYLILAAGLLFVLLLLFLDRLNQRKVLADESVHVWILHIAAVVLVPSAIQFPQYQHVLAYIPQRVSLFVALAFCLMVSRARHGRGVTRLSAVIAAVFFTFLYIDQRAFNGVEDEIAYAVREVPVGERVAGSIIDTKARFNPLAHVVDRACVGRCFSYANYEPATAQFRMRIAEGRRIAAPTVAIAQEIERGEHVVTAAEEPLYSLCLCDPQSKRLCVRRLAAGETTCASSRAVTVPLWGKTPEVKPDTPATPTKLAPDSKPQARRTNN